MRIHQGEYSLRYKDIVREKPQLRQRFNVGERIGWLKLLELTDKDFVLYMLDQFSRDFDRGQCRDLQWAGLTYIERSVKFYCYNLSHKSPDEYMRIIFTAVMSVGDHDSKNKDKVLRALTQLNTQYSNSTDMRFNDCFIRAMDSLCIGYGCPDLSKCFNSFKPLFSRDNLAVSETQVLESGLQSWERRVKTAT